MQIHPRYRAAIGEPGRLGIRVETRCRRALQIGPVDQPVGAELAILDIEHKAEKHHFAGERLGEIVGVASLGAVVEIGEGIGGNGAGAGIEVEGQFALPACRYGISQEGDALRPELRPLPHRPGRQFHGHAGNFLDLAGS